MKTIIQEFGNTLAICIPETFAQQVHMTKGTVVSVSIEDHKLVVLFDDQETEHMSLEQLLAGITEENIHQEIRTGPPVGNEVW